MLAAFLFTRRRRAEADLMTLETAELLGAMLRRMAPGTAVQLIARSPDAPVARELLESLKDIAGRGIRFEAVFVRADAGAFEKVAAAYGAETARRAIRVAAMAEQGDISEQVNFGVQAVWTGGKLKTAPASFAEGTLKPAGEGSDKAKLSAMAFRALWAVSKVPADAWKLGSEPANDASPAPGLRVIKA